MRKGMMLMAVAGLLSLASMAQAQSFSFGLQAGASVPVGDYADFVGPGPMVGVYGDFGMTPSVALGADIVGNFHGMSSDLEDAFSEAGITDFDLTFTVIQFGAHLKWKPASGSGPWVMGGLGLYNGSTKVEFAGLEDTESESKFGFNVGAGIDFGASPAMKFGLMAAFHNVTDAIEEFDTTTGAPTGDTKSAQYVTVGATLTFGTSGP